MDPRIAEFAPSALHYTDVSRTYPDISINEVGEHPSRGVIYVELHAIELYSMKWRIITGCEMHWKTVLITTVITTSITFNYRGNCLAGYVKTSSNGHLLNATTLSAVGYEIFNVQTWKFISLLCPDIDLIIIINELNLPAALSFSACLLLLQVTSSIFRSSPLRRLGRYTKMRHWTLKKEKSHEQSIAINPCDPIIPIHYQSRVVFTFAFHIARAAHKYWNMKNAWEWIFSVSYIWSTAELCTEKERTMILHRENKLLRKSP